MACTKQPARKLTVDKVPRHQLSTKAARRYHSFKLLPMKKNCFFPGTVALREIRYYKKRTDLLLPKLSFQRLVREIAQEINNDVCFQVQALLAVKKA